MEILRVPSSNFSYSLSGLTPGGYSYTLKDLADHSVTIGDFIVESSSDTILIPVPGNIDGEYELTVDGDQERVLDGESISVVRPYVDPNTLGTTASEIADYAKNEMIARAIIDSQLETINFYNKKTVYDVIGNGLDYMPIWKDVNKVLKVYENNVLVFDIDTPETNAFDYQVTLDKTAITKIFTEQTNLITASNPQLPIANSDYAYGQKNLGTFVKGNDYVFVLDSGYKNVPSNIQRATEMLIDDLKCGKLDYYQRYVTGYNTDQFRIQFDKRVLEGTGNIIVDKILSNYARSITRVGVL